VRSVSRILLILILSLSFGCVRQTISGYPSVVTPKQKTDGALNALTDDQHVQALEAKIKLNPKDDAARLELAGIYETYRLYDDAFQQYSAILHNSNSNVSAAVLTGVAHSAQAAGRSPEAIPLLSQVVQDSPSVTAWDQLCMLYEAMGNLTNGENALRQALILDPQSDRLHNNLGYNLLLQDKADAAEEEFRAALLLNPKSITSHNNLGTVLGRRGAVQEALEQFQFGGDAASAHNNLAVALFEAGEYEKSRDELIKALTIRQYFAPALENFKMVQERIRERSEGAPSKKVPEGKQ
jgi:Flp pilus assembly protein TadD